MPKRFIGELLRILTHPLAIYAGARIAPSFSSFVFTLMCIESLPPTQYGKYSLTLIPIMMAASFAGGLAGQPMLRFGTELDVVARRTALTKIPLLAAGISAITLVGYLFLTGHTKVSVAACAALVPLTAVMETRRNLFIAMSNAYLVFLLDSVRSIMALVLLSAILWLGFTTFLMPLLALSLATASSLLLVSPHTKIKQMGGPRQIDSGYLTYGLWVACWLAVVGLMPLLERTLIEWQYGLSATGVYSALADPILAVISAATSVIASALMPLYIQAWNNHSRAKLRRLTVKSVAAIVGAGVLCLIAGAAIVTLNLGHLATLLQSNVLLALLLLAGIVTWAISIFIHKPLELQAKTGVMFVCLLCATGVFAALAFLLMARLGVEGIAIAKICSGIVYIGLVQLGGHVWKVSK